jgi:hypothetical protein
MAKTQVQTRPISEIAAEILADHRAQGKELYFGAVPYVNAMLFLDKYTDNYFEDSAVDVLTYAVSNLSTWRGETARRVKAEIKAMLPW